MHPVDLGAAQSRLCVVAIRLLDRRCSGGDAV
jgi:hypothetical protein